MRSFVVLLLLLPIALPVSAAGSKVEPVGGFADPTASESLRSVLEPKGYRVVLGDGSVACEMWLRNGLPAGPKSGVSGVAYTWLSESTVVGVVSFTKPSTDFRGQAIKPGAYTLRYALHPADGNHMGISPIRDFLLLIPVADDRDPNARFKFEELVKMSAKTSGTNHPAALSLVQPEGYKELPSASENEHGHVVFAAKIKSASGEMPIALIVKGVAEQ